MSPVPFYLSQPRSMDIYLAAMSSLSDIGTAMSQLICVSNNDKTSRFVCDLLFWHASRFQYSVVYVRL